MATNIDEIVDKASRQFASHRPTVSELRAFVTGLGVAEGALLLAALSLIYDIVRANQKPPAAEYARPVCVHLVKGEKCGAAIVHLEIDEDEGARYLVQICARKHEVRRALPKRS